MKKDIPEIKLKIFVDFEFLLDGGRMEVERVFQHYFRGIDSK